MRLKASTDRTNRTPSAEAACRSPNRVAPFLTGALSLLASIASPGCTRDRHGVRPLPATVDLHALQNRYGEALYSQDDEETLIRAFFADRRAGVFLDVGAGDPVRDSTTLYLEKHLGWHGIAVDAIVEYAGSYAEQRPGTRFFNYFAGRKSRLTHDFFVSDDKNFSSGTGSDPRGGTYRKTRVETIALRDLLEREHVGGIDFLSVDIEGAEPDALAGLDLRRFPPELACIEVGSAAIRLAVTEQFALAGCREVTAYRAVDAINRYYSCR